MVTLHVELPTDHMSLLSDTAKEPHIFTTLGLQRVRNLFVGKLDLTGLLAVSDLSYHASGANVCRRLRTGRWTRRQTGAFRLGEAFVPLGHLSFPDASDLVFPLARD